MFSYTDEYNFKEQSRLLPENGSSKLFHQPASSSLNVLNTELPRRETYCWTQYILFQCFVFVVL